MTNATGVAYGMEERSVHVQAEVEIVLSTDGKHHQDRIRDFGWCYLEFLRWSFQNSSGNTSKQFDLYSVRSETV